MQIHYEMKGLRCFAFQLSSHFVKQYSLDSAKSIECILMETHTKALNIQVEFNYKKITSL